MGKFYEYPQPNTLSGDEKTVLFQNDNNSQTMDTKSCTINQIKAEVFDLAYISSSGVSGPDSGQMLTYKLGSWVNGNDPELKGYLESEYIVPITSGNVTIELRNGNVQRVTPTGAMTILLPGVPDIGKNWSVVVKILFNGSITPTFTSPNTIKWSESDTAPVMQGSNTLNIYVFTSDSSLGWVCGNLVLKSM